MNKNTLLLIASLAVLTSGASAASNQTESPLVVLPTYVVTAPRYLPVEQQINASLEELSQQARPPVAIAPELPMLKVQAPQHNALTATARAAQAGRIAKS